MPDPANAVWAEYWQVGIGLVGFASQSVDLILLCKHLSQVPPCAFKSHSQWCALEEGLVLYRSLFGKLIKPTPSFSLCPRPGESLLSSTHHASQASLTRQEPNSALGHNTPGFFSICRDREDKRLKRHIIFKRKAAPTHRSTILICKPYLHGLAHNTPPRLYPMDATLPQVHSQPTSPSLTFFQTYVDSPSATIRFEAYRRQTQDYPR